MKLKRLSILVASLALAACVTSGGGYGPDDKSARPIRADDKPYVGEFPRGAGATKFDNEVYKEAIFGDQPLAWAIGDFYDDGTQGKFAAIQRYNPVQALESIKEDPKRFNGRFSLWHTDPKTGKQTETWSMIGCLHPRHAAAADFNHDGKLDVVVGCQGYEREDNQAGLSQPGEYSVMLINDGKGRFTASKFGHSDSFHHGISAGDINGDGYADIVVAAPEGKRPDVQAPVYFWINEKDGTFKEDNYRIVGVLPNGSYTLARLVDIDGDGILDLLVGGETHSGAIAAVLFGDKDGKFGRDRINIPAVKDQGLVLDILPVTNNGERVLYVLRTGDENFGAQRTETKGYYRGMTIQAVNLTTGKETIYRSDRSWLSDLLPAVRNGQHGVVAYDEMKAGTWFISNTLVEAPK